MRKFFALALAVAMVMSLASVSFAATSYIDTAAFGKAHDYSGDSDSLKTNKTYTTANGVTIDLKNMIEYGDTAYFPLVESGVPMSDFDQVEKLKIKAEFEMGEDLVDSISIVKKSVKKVDGSANAVDADFENLSVADLIEETTAPAVTVKWANITAGSEDFTVTVASTAYGAITTAEADLKATVTDIINDAMIDYYAVADIPAAEITAAETAAWGVANTQIGNINNAIATAINGVTDVDDLDVADGSGDAATIDDVIANKGSAAIGDTVSTYTFTVKDTVVAEAIADAIEANFDVDAIATAVAGAITDAVADEAIVSWGDVAADYYYFVAVKTNKVQTTADADVIGTFEFNRKAVKENGVIVYPEIKDEEIDFAINLWYDGNYNAEDSTGVTPLKVEDEASLKWDDMYVLKFESDDEVTLNFGYENEGEFVVDASGQGKMLINFNTKANEAICDANPGVEMFFVNFNDAKFNRTGTFEYEMEDMVAAYKVVDDQLVEIAGLELDGDTATFSTRTLGNYVFAAAELVNPTVAVEAPVVEAPAVTNPSTGA